MRTLFQLSYGLLWVLVVLQTLVLQAALRETVWFKRLHADFGGRRMPDRLRKGTPVPRFAAPLLGSEQILSSPQLRGHSSILLFVSAEEPFSPSYENLSIAIHAFWHKVEGHLWLLCSGGEQPCRRLAAAHQVQGLSEHAVPIALDEGARIAQSFLINSTPRAVMLDEQARVSRYGNPLSRPAVEQ